MFEKNCEVCKRKMFRRKYSEAMRNNWKFCSRICKTIKSNQNRKIVVAKIILCKNCKSSFEAYTKNQNKKQFCSQKCSLVFRNKSIENREKVRLALSGEKSYMWKGDKAGYFAIHVWLRKKYGSANKCEQCKRKNAPKYEWANISKKYKRDILDYIQLCTSCHNYYDRV